MTDENENVTTPVPVNGNVASVQASALVRQIALALGSIVAAIGFAKAAGYLTIIASLAGPIVTAVGAFGALGALVWGQIHTRINAKKVATIAADPRVPDSVAYIK